MTREEAVKHLIDAVTEDTLKSGGLNENEVRTTVSELVGIITDGLDTREITHIAKTYVHVEV